MAEQRTTKENLQIALRASAEERYPEPRLGETRAVLEMSFAGAPSDM